MLLGHTVNEYEPPSIIQELFNRSVTDTRNARQSHPLAHQGIRAFAQPSRRKVTSLIEYLTLTPPRLCLHSTTLSFGQMFTKPQALVYVIVIQYRSNISRPASARKIRHKTLHIVWSTNHWQTPAITS